jgi:Fur family ferric uptake transcriptional regulator
MSAFPKPDYTFDEYLDCFLAFLQQKKLKGTYERGYILFAVYELEPHFTMAILEERVRQYKYRISKATLYHTLELLMEAGLLMKHYFSNQAQPQYEKLYNNKTHAHLCLNKAQKVIDFSDSRIDEIIKDIGKQYNVSPTRYSFVVYCEEE